MKRQIIYFLAAALSAGVMQAQDANPVVKPVAPPAPVEPPKTDYSKIFSSDKEKNSYAVGMNAGQGLKSQLTRAEFDSDIDALSRGFKDAVGNGTNVISEDQEREILVSLQNEIRAKMAEKQKQVAEEQRIKGEKNLKEGPAFLAENKKAPGITTTASGLQYKVITEGTGPMPKADDEVSVNYRGTLIDGTEFDNSYKRGKPFHTRVTGGVISGWTEVLQLMKVGSKYQVFIPSDLAYKANPMGTVIAPNSVLIFEMELLAILPHSAPPPGVSPVSARPGTPLTSDIIKVPSAEEIKKGAKIETIKANDGN